MTLLIYDTAGKVWVQMTGNYNIPEGIPYLEVEIPEGKVVAGIDTTAVPRVPIYVDAPVPSIEQIKDEVDNIDACMDALFENILPMLEQMIQEVRGGE